MTREQFKLFLFREKGNSSKKEFITFLREAAIICEMEADKVERDLNINGEDKPNTKKLGSFCNEEDSCCNEPQCCKEEVQCCNEEVQCCNEEVQCCNEEVQCCNEEVPCCEEIKLENSCTNTLTSRTTFVSNRSMDNCCG